MPTMPRTTRALGRVEIISSQVFSTPQICRSCRHLALRQRPASHQSLRHSSSKEIPFAEKVRRKVWGQVDTQDVTVPYGEENFLEKRRKERAQQKQAEALQELEDELAKATSTSQSGGMSRRIGEDVLSSYMPKDYVRAETWDGLEHVGHQGHWRDMPPKPEDEFAPFLVSDQHKASQPEHFLAAIHQAMVEIFTLQQAGKSLNLATRSNTWYPEIQELIARTKVTLHPSQARPELAYPTENTRGIIIGWFLKMQRRKFQMEEQSLRGNADGLDDLADGSETDMHDGAVASGNVEPHENRNANADALDQNVNDTTALEQDILLEDERQAERQRYDFALQHGREGTFQHPTKFSLFYEGVESATFQADLSYLDMNFNLKDELTFQLFRRITQLTGLGVPDPVLAEAKTLRSIYNYQLQAIKPKPKNLAETLAIKEDLASLPNVKIISRRETSVDKEKAVGRWKLIEAELRSRGLPVLGRPEA